jgi:hypothetical protein
MSSTASPTVAKSMLGEMTDKTNEAKAFAMLGIAQGIGSIGKS